MKSYKLRNVKAFGETCDIELAPLTLFVGQNSCGKSSLIRFPVLLTQAIRDDAYPIRLFSERTNLVDYGTFRDTLHNHAGNEFSFSFSYSYDMLPCIEDKLADIGLTTVDDMIFEMDTGEETSIPTMKNISAEITYAGDLPSGRIEPWILLSSYSILFDNVCIAKMTLNNDGDYTLSLNSIKYGEITEDWYKFTVKATQDSLTPIIDKNEAYIQIIKECLNLSKEESLKIRNKFNFLDGSNYFYALSVPQRIKCVLEEIPFLLEDKFKEIIERIKCFEYFCIIKSSLDEAIMAEMKNVCYIGPFRNNPERIYRRDNREIVSVGKNGEDAVKLLINNKKATEQASRWFEEFFDYQLSVEPLGNSGYYQVFLNNKKTNTKSNIMDVGYGISQILPIVSQIAAVSINHTANSKGNELYIIEQPELHLHPNAQASLADLFASVIKKNAGTNRTILIETHSEHLIRGLQLLIANANSPYHIEAGMVKVYYVHGQAEKKDQDGSWLEEMEIDKTGQFKQKWPSGFFDKAYQLTKELAHTILARNREEGK